MRVLDLQLVMLLRLPFLAKYKGWIVFDFKLLEDIVGTGLRAGGLILLRIVLLVIASIATMRMVLLRHDRLESRMDSRLDLRMINRMIN